MNRQLRWKGFFSFLILPPDPGGNKEKSKKEDLFSATQGDACIGDPDSTPERKKGKCCRVLFRESEHRCGISSALSLSGEENGLYATGRARYFAALRYIS